MTKGLQWCVPVMLIISCIFISSFPVSAQNQYNPGLQIIDLEYKSEEGNLEPVTVAIWYPTTEAPQKFVYQTVEDYESKVALNAPVAREGSPYPLIIYSHGAYASGYDAAYFNEFLARNGYIVAAPDYRDTVPPRYTEQIAFSRIKEGKTARPLRVVLTAKKLVEDMNNDRELLFTYMENRRLKQASFALNSLFELNRTAGSFLAQKIDEGEVGAFGHSLGGVTTMGIIGAHPDSRFHDKRIKAALLFSSPAYPFEETVAQVTIPVMLMAGDNDEPGLGPQVPRRTLNDNANAPKYYMVFKDATHFSFGNRGSGGGPLDEAVSNSPLSRAIVQYGLSFFETYLRHSKESKQYLQTFDSALVYYVKSEYQGELKEWGEEPPPGKDGVGGIRELFKGGESPSRQRTFRRRRGSFWQR